MGFSSLDDKKLVQLSYMPSDGDYSVDLTDITEIVALVTQGGYCRASVTVPIEAFKELPLNPNSLNYGGVVRYINDNCIRCELLTSYTVLFVFGKK